MTNTQAHARRWELEIMGEFDSVEDDLIELRARRRRDSIVKKTGNNGGTDLHALLRKIHVP